MDIISYNGSIFVSYSEKMSNGSTTSLATELLIIINNFKIYLGIPIINLIIIWWYFEKMRLFI